MLHHLTIQLQFKKKQDCIFNDNCDRIFFVFLKFSPKFEP